MFRSWKKKRETEYVKSLPERLASEWEDFQPDPWGDYWNVPCAKCPKFDRFPPRCTVPIGSRMRSCVCASIEYHLRNVRGLNVLEIGCGENPFTRHVVEAAGGEWTGVDPRPGKKGLKSVRSLEGSANHLPFEDEQFDVIVDIQTLEHWGCPYSEPKDCDYASAFAEIWRALRPGGFIYFDAPIHLHGAQEFIQGELDKIRIFFTTQLWTHITLTAWRRSHRPLRKIIAAKAERLRWPEIFGHDPAVLRELKGRSAWVLGIRADKPATDSTAP